MGSWMERRNSSSCVRPGNIRNICSYREVSTGLIIRENEDRPPSAVRSRERTENRSMPGHECLYGSHAQPKCRKGAHERQSRIGTCTQLDFCADRARNTQGSSMAVVQIHWLSLWQLSLPHFKCGKTAAQSAVKGCRIGWETALVRAQSMAVRG